MRAGSSRTRTVLRGLFALAGLASLVAAFLATWDRSEGLPLASWPRLILAGTIVVVGLGLATRSWAALLDVSPRARFARGFLLSQLGKYVPGGVWQALGQVEYARGYVSGHHATVAFAAFMFTQAATGATVGVAAALLSSEVTAWIRLAVLPAPLLLITLDRRWMVRIVRWYVRWRGVETDADQLVPGQDHILRSAAWSVLVHLVMGVGFALTLPDVGGATFAAAVPAYALAWTVGFLALPFPAGLGVREGALALLLPPLALPTLIAGSVVYRLIVMIGEVVAIGLAHLLREDEEKAEA